MVMRIVVTEEQKKGISHKLMGMIDNNGLLNTIKFITVWEFDEDGQMYDEYFDDYDVRVNKLETKYLNKLFEMLVNNYLS